MSTISGHCFCNAIRFEVEAPESFACYCYCNSCQRASGAPVVAWATYAKDSFRIKQGKMQWNQSSPDVTRGHCANCGSSMTYENSKRPGEIDLTLSSLDDPSGPKLRAHIWTCDKPEWMAICDELPAYEKNIGSLGMPSTTP